MCSYTHICIHYCERVRIAPAVVWINLFCWRGGPPGRRRVGVQHTRQDAGHTRHGEWQITSPRYGWLKTGTARHATWSLVLARPPGGWQLSPTSDAGHTATRARRQQHTAPGTAARRASLALTPTDIPAHRAACWRPLVTRPSLHRDAGVMLPSHIRIWR